MKGIGIWGIAVGILLAGCASMHKEISQSGEEEYRSRPQLHAALATESLDEHTIQKILSSKVMLPKKVSLAIVRLSEYGGELNAITVDKDVASGLYRREIWGDRVQSVTPVPTVLLASPVTLKSLRQAAVLLQADALLIIKPVSSGTWKEQWFEANLAKSKTSLEVLLLDTRTSVVPFTAIVSETAEIKKGDEDYNNFDLLSRARQESEKKALLQVAPQVTEYISRVM